MRTPYIIALLALSCTTIVVSCKKKDQPKPPPAFSFESFSGDVDSIPFTATAYSATIENGIMNIHAETPTQTFELIFEASLQPGVYQLPGGSYTENGHLYELVDGHISILVYDTVQHFIGGQFSTETSDFTGSPSKWSEGEFVIHYTN
jgi:hypothetical protein